MRVSILAAAIVGTALLGTATASSAALPTPNASYVLVREARNNNVGLTMVNMATSQAYPLTGSKTQDTADNWSAWSGNGLRVAFVRDGSDSTNLDDENGSGLYLYNLNLQRETRMTSKLRGIAQPVWGTSTQLAFTASTVLKGTDRYGNPTSDTYQCVYLLPNVPSRTLKRLFCGGDTSNTSTNAILKLQWSADKRYLYAVDRFTTFGLDWVNETTRTVKIDPQTGAATNVGTEWSEGDIEGPANGVVDATIAPDGKDVYYGFGDASGGFDWTSLVTGEYVSNRYPYEYPRYSNNSKKLAGTQSGTSAQVVITNRDGSGAVFLGKYPAGVSVLDWSANNVLLAVKSGDTSSVLRIKDGATLKIKPQYAFGDGQLWFKPGR